MAQDLREGRIAPSHRIEDLGDGAEGVGDRDLDSASSHDFTGLSEQEDPHRTVHGSTRAKQAFWRFRDADAPTDSAA